MQNDPNRKFDTFHGVFVRVAVSIFGVLMFLRLGWMVVRFKLFSRLEL